MLQTAAALLALPPSPRVLRSALARRPACRRAPLASPGAPPGAGPCDSLPETGGEESGTGVGEIWRGELRELGQPSREGGRAAARVPWREARPLSLAASLSGCRASFPSSARLALPPSPPPSPERPFSATSWALLSWLPREGGRERERLPYILPSLAPPPRRRSYAFPPSPIPCVKAHRGQENVARYSTGLKSPGSHPPPAHSNKHPGEGRGGERSSTRLSGLGGCHR